MQNENGNLGHTTFYVGDTYVIKYSPNNAVHKEAFVFLHGFPAKSEQNDDLAMMAAQEKNVDSYVFHYPGANKGKGEFRFLKAITEAQKTVEILIAEHKYTKITLVGHSWGGFVAVNLAANLSGICKNLILMAPLFLIPDDNGLSAIIQSLWSPHAENMFKAPMAEGISSFQSIRPYSPDVMVSKGMLKNIETVIIQGNQDNEINRHQTRKAVDFLLDKNESVEYLEIPCDHGFLPRPVILKYFKKVLG